MTNSALLFDHDDAFRSLLRSALRCTAIVIVASLLSSPAEGTQFVRGDVDQNEALEISDAVFVFNYLFLGGARPACIDAADFNDDGALDLSDGVAELNFLFLGGPSPPAPHPKCGDDPSDDALSCESFATCSTSACDDCDEGFACVPNGVDSFICTSELTTCEEITNLYEFLVSELGRTCGDEGNCHVVWGHCGVGIGGCYYVLNDLVSQEDLNVLGRLFSEGGCTRFVCDCAPLPEEFGCEEDVCRFAR
jgi:hypothetical protein